MKLRHNKYTALHLPSTLVVELDVLVEVGPGTPLPPRGAVTSATARETSIRAWKYVENLPESPQPKPMPDNKDKSYEPATGGNCTEQTEKDWRHNHNTKENG